MGKRTWCLPWGRTVMPGMEVERGIRIMAGRIERDVQ